jgi:hypothetical protein
MRGTADITKTGRRRATRSSLTDAKSGACQWSWPRLTAYEIEHRMHHHFLFDCFCKTKCDGQQIQTALALCNHRAHTAGAHIADRGNHSEINTLC